MIKLAFQLLMLYLLYKFIFDFLVPLARTTKHMKQQVGDMQAGMRAQEEALRQYARQASASNAQTSNAASTPKKGDYIDFEEVK